MLHINQLHKHIKNTLAYWPEPCSSLCIAIHVPTHPLWKALVFNLSQLSTFDILLLESLWHREVLHHFKSFVTVWEHISSYLPPIPFNTHKGTDSNFRWKQIYWGEANCWIAVISLSNGRPWALKEERRVRYCGWWLDEETHTEKCGETGDLAVWMIHFDPQWLYKFGNFI